MKYFESRNKNEEPNPDALFVAYQLEYIYYEKYSRKLLQTENRSIIYEIRENNNMSAIV
jgi:hypothetical protein